jgi:BlaI family penicillinase repressor
MKILSSLGKTGTAPSVFITGGSGRLIFFIRTLDTIYYLSNITQVIIKAPMRANPLHRLGNLQLRIMKALWTRNEATVAEVQQSLIGAPPLAYTTVATMLRKMENRSLVSHRTEGRSFIYRAAVAEDAVTRSMADDLLDRVFEGNLSDMVSHLLSTREVSRQELRKLERLIAERKNGL